MHIAMVSLATAEGEWIPDSYAAFDDQTSTFIIPSGPGFEVVFCPPGRSSTIVKSMSSQRLEFARHGLSPKLLAEAQNATLIKAQSGSPGSASLVTTVLLLAAWTFGLALARSV